MATDDTTTDTGPRGFGRLGRLIPRRPAAAAGVRKRRWLRLPPAPLAIPALLAAAVALWAPWVDHDAPRQRQKPPAAAARQVGLASWYGPGFYGRQTASGSVYTGADMTAAHRSLPLGTMVRVTNLKNGRRVLVEVDDRGPYVGGRVIDLSVAAARRLDMVRDGVARVRVDVISPAPPKRA